MNTEIQKQLHELALKKSKPFCYHCYKVAPTGRCSTCSSDDLMRLLPEVGCEYGTEWIIEHILKEELTPVDLDETFEDSIRSCYPETVQVGWMNLDAVQVMKDQDPISWEMAKNEWIDQESENESLVTFDNGSSYYYFKDVEELL